MLPHRIQLHCIVCTPLSRNQIFRSTTQRSVHGSRINSPLRRPYYQQLLQGLANQAITCSLVVLLSALVWNTGMQRSPMLKRCLLLFSAYTNSDANVHQGHQYSAVRHWLHCKKYSAGLQGGKIRRLSGLRHRIRAHRFISY